MKIPARAGGLDCPWSPATKKIQFAARTVGSNLTEFKRGPPRLPPTNKVP